MAAIPSKELTFFLNLLSFIRLFDFFFLILQEDAKREDEAATRFLLAFWQELLSRIPVRAYQIDGKKDLKKHYIYI